MGKIPSGQQLQTFNNLYICTSAILDFADLLFPPTIPWTEQTKLPRMNMTTHHMIYHICTLSLVWRLAFWLWQKYEAIGSGWSGCGYLGHMETINKSCFEKKLPNDPTDLILGLQLDWILGCIVETGSKPKKIAAGGQAHETGGKWNFQLQVWVEGLHKKTGELKTVLPGRFWVLIGCNPSCLSLFWVLILQEVFLLVVVVVCSVSSCSRNCNLDLVGRHVCQFLLSSRL